MKTITRIITLPAVAFIFAISLLRHFFVAMWYWLRHGGELITYGHDRKLIADVYYKLVQSQRENSNLNLELTKVLVEQIHENSKNT